MNPHRPDIALVSLGCPKNLVDSECMTGILETDGFRLVPDPSQAEVIVVNTCGFIESAKKEAIDTILAQESTDVACIYCAIGQKATSSRFAGRFSVSGALA